MVELTHVTRFARLMATSVRKSVSRGGFPERGELAGEVRDAHLPDKAPESLEDFLKPGADEAENARDEREGLRGDKAYATPSQLRAMCFAPSVEALSAPEIPVPLAGLVVAESSWTLAAPILLGGEAEVGASVSSIRRSERGTEVTVRGLVYADGGLVYAEETLYIAKKLTGEPREWGERLPFGGFDLRRQRGVDSMGRLDVGNRPAVAERNSQWRIPGCGRATRATSTRSTCRTPRLGFSASVARFSTERRSRRGRRTVWAWTGRRDAGAKRSSARPRSSPRAWS